MRSEQAVFGGGCFWCLEAIFQEVRGVESVVSGYAGGVNAHPTYEQVCKGETGHAEVVRIEFNPEVVSYATLVNIFFTIHDPTTLNRQGNDVGTQYRSVIFYENDAQKEVALSTLEAVRSQFVKPIVTEVKPLPPFYEAEVYHQNYFRTHPTQGYCAFVISPKVGHFREENPQLLL